MIDKQAHDWSGWALTLVNERCELLTNINVQEFFNGLPKGFTLDYAVKRLNRIDREGRILFLSRSKTHFVRAVYTSFRRVGLAVQRWDSQPMGWEELQKIKNEIVGSDRWAHELFPPESEKVNLANTYHLLVYNRDERPLGCLPRSCQDQPTFAWKPSELVSGNPAPAGYERLAVASAIF